MKYTIFITGVMILIISCASQRAFQRSEERPQWTLEGKHPSYPQSKYLTGFGRGKSTQEADDSARAEIAKIFKVNVMEITHSSEFYTQKGEEVSHIFDIEKTTQASTELTLEGVLISERFEDGEDFYALALLDKQKTSSSIRKKGLELSKEIQELYKKGNEENNPLKKFTILKRVLSRLIELSVLNSQLIVLGAGEVKPSVSLFKIEEEVISLSREKLRFGIDITGSGGETLQSILGEEISKNGFVVSTQPPFHILIGGSIKIEKIQRPPDEYEWLKYEVGLKVKEGEEQKIIFEKNYSDNVGHASFEQAKKRIFYLLKKEKIKDFVSELKKIVFEEN